MLFLNQLSFEQYFNLENYSNKSINLHKRLEETADMLQKKIAHLESQVEEQEKIIKANVNTNKKKAMDALKRKKRYEEQIKGAEGKEIDILQLI